MWLILKQIPSSLKPSLTNAVPMYVVPAVPLFNINSCFYIVFETIGNTATPCVEKYIFPVALFLKKQTKTKQKKNNFKIDNNGAPEVFVLVIHRIHYIDLVFLYPPTSDNHFHYVRIGNLVSLDLHIFLKLLPVPRPHFLYVSPDNFTLENGGGKISTSRSL